MHLQIARKNHHLITLCFVIIISMLKRGQGIAAFDEPAEGKEGDSSKNGGAPCVRVPLAVLPRCKPPLLPQRHRVWIRRVWTIRKISLRRIRKTSLRTRGDFA
ncbi:hypothetical protein AMTR_s00015p00223130 [Amborella trichopoda]|uniref:Secreted protein n=1 Tax=Amborella trichopoda TaxID=13333 RepID=W1PLI4_AMBTC|nr:hypothetical protein AMTR_s00015p00223130 [Amborella trichopoda]